MAANTVPIFPLSPLTKACSLVAASACTSRGPTAHASMGSTPVFAVELVPTSTNGCRIDMIQVKNAATAIAGAFTAGSMIIWLDDGTTGVPIDEILLTAGATSASVASMLGQKSFTNLVLKPTDSIWVSTTIVGAAAAHAPVAVAFGGTY